MVRIYKLSKLPSIAEYVAGLTAIQPRISELQLRLLQAQYGASKRTVTATQLANLTGISHPVVNSQYGRLGHIFCDEIGFDPSKYIDDKYWWWSVWSIGYETHDQGYLWEMHPEVAEVLETLGWVDNAITGFATVFPDEVDSTEIFCEGAVRQIAVNAYERDPKARQKCIDYYGSNCSVCDFNFGKVFGQLGEGFIHVHHLRPISEIAQEYEVDPIKDLRPVCPNCHAMIHRRSPLLSIEEIIELKKSLE